MDSTTTSLRAALVGYGAMGREIERLAPSNSVDITARFDSRTPFDPSGPHAEGFDVAIEFTSPVVVVDNILALLAAGKPVVVGTTGWLDRISEIERAVAERDGRLIYASNFSIGVNIFFRIVRQAAARFNGVPMYDAGVHEIHHLRKADSPSGTAMSLASILLEELERKTTALTETSHGRIGEEDLHVTSSRIGATVGTHTVLFDSEADTIELTHRAKNRSGFALGALTAARWIMEKPPGLYRFDEIF